MLVRNCTFSQDGWTFHYLAGSARLQVYIPNRNAQTGEVDPFYEHIDEVEIRADTRAELKLRATAWVSDNQETGGGTADDYRREMARWRPDLVL